MLSPIEEQRFIDHISNIIVEYRNNINIKMNALSDYVSANTSIQNMIKSSKTNIQKSMDDCDQNIICDVGLLLRNMKEFIPVEETVNVNNTWKPLFLPVRYIENEYHGISGSFFYKLLISDPNEIGDVLKIKTNNQSARNILHLNTREFLKKLISNDIILAKRKKRKILERAKKDGINLDELSRKDY